MTKEALTLALEALHGFIPYLPLNDEEQCGRYDQAITAIKEVLADPSPNFNCKSVQARLATAWGYVKAQPEQEPVAWMYPDALCDKACLYLCTKGFTQFPECATPPQRKPLTDEQIKGIYEDCDAPTGGQFTLAFTRAIEAAHGIKEKT